MHSFIKSSTSSSDSKSFSLFSSSFPSSRGSRSAPQKSLFPCSSFLFFAHRRCTSTCALSSHGRRRNSHSGLWQDVCTRQRAWWWFPSDIIVVMTTTTTTISKSTTMQSSLPPLSRCSFCCGPRKSQSPDRTNERTNEEVDDEINPKEKERFSKILYNCIKRTLNTCFKKTNNNA